MVKHSLRIEIKNAILVDTILLKWQQLWIKEHEWNKRTWAK